MRFLVTIQISWGDPRVPIGHPNDPHTGNMFLVTHNPYYSLFKVNNIASLGIRKSAEYGVVDELKMESQKSPDVYKIYTSDVLKAPGVRTFIIEDNSMFPLFSFTTMLAPSPDWFTGITNIDLRSITNHTFPLYAYDSGSAYGSIFMTEPKYHRKMLIPISYKADAPFFPTGNVIPIGYININKL
jgi:hypothetical protein